MVSFLKIWLSLALLFCYCYSLGNGAYKLQERYNWNQLDFAFPNQRLKEQAMANGDYVPQNGLPVGVEHWGNRLFVTVPRWRDGKHSYGYHNDSQNNYLPNCYLLNKKCYSNRI
uniref:Protein yellow n=1 Tax=Glossina palpalis gambiensis TaxID=67801 RepID=A0A1B0AP85_9MUSC